MPEFSNYVEGLDSVADEDVNGNEQIPVSKNGSAAKLTAQQIANLAGGLTDPYTSPFPQVTASGTDTYTATLSPAISAYAVGQKFQILFTNANTGAATLALNGLSALAITKNGTTALAAGDIAAGSIKLLAYDGTRLQIVGDGGGSGGSGTVESVTGDGVDNTDPDNPVIELPIGLASANTTGVAVSFVVPQIYGTPGSPETGNITLNTTGLVQGIVQTMYHQNGTEPTYPSEFIRLGSGTYSTAVRNIIFMHAVSATRIEYVVTQEQ